MSDYTKDNPYYSAIVERYALNQPGSQKNTQHLVLDLGDSDLSYQPGDCIAILPANYESMVELLLDRIRASGVESITPRREEKCLPIGEWLRKKADLAQVNKSLLRLLAGREKNSGKRTQLCQLLEDRTAFKAFQAENQVWDVLNCHNEIEVTPQELADTLSPLMPRFYSIASSMACVGNQVHLTVANFRYHLNNLERRGVASHLLCDRLPLHEPVVPLYIQPTRHFTLPTDPQRPIIMIGPGTGIAPFRAFLQERTAHSHTGGNWLFFGDWTRQYDFLYGDYWNTLSQAGKLRLSTAFSRDQEEKIYVQHRMWEERHDLWAWIQSGATLYVCGDASCMAKDVETILLKIFEECGSLSPDESHALLKHLRVEKRYLRDVY